MLSSLLNHVFPRVADSTAADGYWVAKAISSQRKELTFFRKRLQRLRNGKSYSPWKLNSRGNTLCVKGGGKTYHCGEEKVYHRGNG